MNMRFKLMLYMCLWIPQLITICSLWIYLDTYESNLLYHRYDHWPLMVLFLCVAHGLVSLLCVYGLIPYFHKMMERLAYRSNPQKQLLENMSHELRTPLAIIDSYAHLLKRWAGSTPQLREEAIDAILKESQHLQSTTEHFLHLFNHHETYMDWKLFDLVPLLVSVVNDLQTTFKRNIHIDRFGDTPATCVIEGDATKIKHLIVIILDNALKYSHQPIHVKLSVMTTYILIQVTDQGIGIDPTDVLYVFDRFYRSKRAITHHRQGVGLGLAIADQIVRLHQGAISISSEPHIRTTVTVKLPCQHRKSQ